MLALNIKQEPKKVIFDRFNALNALQLNPDDFLLSSVEAFNDAQRKTNTRVLASPVVDSSGYNAFHIYYNRMDLGEVFDRINLEVKSTGLDKLVEILDMVNTELGIYLTADDIVDADIIYDDPADRTLRATVDVVAQATSYLFSGNHTLVLNEKINPYDPGIKKAVTGLAFISDGTNTDITNINTSISEELYFGFLDGVTVNATPDVKGIRLIDNGAYIFGDFNLDVPNTITGSQGNTTYQGVTINRIGKVIAVDKVARFDNVYQKDVNFSAKPDGTKFYLADKRKYITNGNIVGLYRYNNKGERDNTLVTTNMSLIVDKVLPLETGFIAASEMQLTPKRVVKIQRYNENGSVSTEMPEIQIGDVLGIDIEVQGMVLSHNDSGVVDGFYVLLRNFFSQSIVPTVDGVKVYGDKHLNKSNYILPVLKFTMEGILDTTFNGNLQKASKDFFQPEIGLHHFDRLFPQKDGFILFNKVRNPITGVFTLVGLRVRRDGSYKFLTGDEYFDLPMVKSVIAVDQNDNTFLASVVVEEVDNNDLIIEKPKVIGFNENGVYTGVYLELDAPLSIQDMVIFKN